ncbi:molybdopterin cofactor-binding domain-containing protein [uncultured Sphingomonas sp.]|uniref:xanthine dehydrogenase family protein molybdopterin-binding subunit n=1 Tax=uncultured Sphingomonas sp. TaxID=158754 RepID=UPI0025FEF338|nr:molybdopterin cofactor-binding domain-containing protein [uncultured Sphingomonas sp.]
MAEPHAKGIDRRTMLIGGGAGAGLLLAWGLWPRGYRPNLAPREGETVLNAFVKIDTAGRVTAVVPQAEMGQGIWTALAQALADELGADWRQVGVEPAPLNPLYANTLLAGELAEAAAPRLLQGIGGWTARQWATRNTLMVTAGSTSVRAFEQPFREAGAAARALLCMAAGKRIGADWRACDTEAGFVVRGDDRFRFGDLAGEAAGFAPPAEPPLRRPGEGGISGRSVPRLDYPAKVDGTMRYAGDVRLPDMLFAAIRHGPLGDTTYHGGDMAAADTQAGVSGIVRTDRWVAALADNGWAAERALDRLAPRFATTGALPDSAAVAKALDGALAGETTRLVERGDAAPLLTGPGLVEATYDVPLAAHATIEPLVATARVTDDRLELWAPSQAPGVAIAAVAAATGFAESRITLYPMPIGGGFGRKLDHDAMVEAATLAIQAKRPVQLHYSRHEEMLRGRHGPPARAQLSGRVDGQGRIAAWRTRIATPNGANGVDGLERVGGAASITGVEPPYAIPALRIDHGVAEIGFPTGVWRSGAHAATTFFTEGFVDELATRAARDALSFRMGLLGHNPRLARCLSQAAAAGGWSGEPQSGQGLACLSAFGSHIALFAEAGLDGDAIRVSRLVAVADIGRVLHPDSARQQIESGLVWGLASALGNPLTLSRGLVEQRGFDALRLPRMKDMPEFEITLIRSAAPPGGVAELAVPLAPPAIANALFSATGNRLRSLPLMGA